MLLYPPPFMSRPYMYVCVHIVQENEELNGDIWGLQESSSEIGVHSNIHMCHY